MIVYSVESEQGLAEDMLLMEGEVVLQETFFATLKDAREAAQEHYSWLLTQWEKRKKLKERDKRISPIEKPERPTIHRNTITDQFGGRALVAALLNDRQWRAAQKEVKW